MTTGHRLNRGGDRHANAAFYRIVMVRLRGAALREAIDLVLAGPKTGRFDIYAADVHETERTYLGTPGRPPARGVLVKAARRSTTVARSG
jgi:hypothetical protein